MAESWSHPSASAEPFFLIYSLGPNKTTTEILPDMGIHILSLFFFFLSTLDRFFATEILISFGHSLNLILQCFSNVWVAEFSSSVFNSVIQN